MKSKKPSKPETIARVVIRLLVPLFGAWLACSGGAEFAPLPGP